MTDADLFHVTTKWKAKNILKRGMEINMPSSEKEGYLQTWMDERGITELTSDVVEQFQQEYRPLPSGQSPEVWAREKLNEILPDHYDSLFFWANEEKAEQIRRDMERKTRGKDYVIVGVDSDKLSKKGYVANFELSDEIFSELMTIYEDNPHHAEEQERMEEVYDMIEEYKNSVEEYNGQENSSVEVLYPTSVPREAIVTLNGKDVSIDKSQTSLKQFKQPIRGGRGRGWHQEPGRHSLASRGLKTVRRKSHDQ